ncbi:hypothetical protein VPH35_112845 [Triticum aestivum]
MVRAPSPSSLLYAPLLVVTALVGQYPTGSLRVATAQTVAAPVPVRVGVIMDWSTKASSAVSLRRRTGIQMAVEDYYAAHPESAARVELRFSDSKGEVVAPPPPRRPRPRALLLCHLPVSLPGADAVLRAHRRQRLLPGHPRRCRPRKLRVARRDRPARGLPVRRRHPPGARRRAPERRWRGDRGPRGCAERRGRRRPRRAALPPQGDANARVRHLDRLGVSATGEVLLRAVLNTTFDGMIVNIIGNGAMTVGYWTPESGISRDLKVGSGKAARQLKPILWPGEMLSPPRGWTASQNERVLNVAVPVKHGFKQFVDVFSENSTTPKITGYCIDVFDAVMKNLPYPVSYRYVPYNASSESYEMLVDQVSEGKADMAVGDVTIRASRMDKVDFTVPFTESGWAMVVATRPDTSASVWIFLQPLTTSLWLTSLAFFCFTGFVVWVIEHRINPEFRGTPSQQFGLIFYFGFSTLVFAHKEKLESNLSRFVVIIWVFVVLILTSSYTASLTRGQYIGYQEGTFIEPMLKKMGFDDRRMKKYSTVEQYAVALSKGSANGGVDAVFDEMPYLKTFLSQHCDGYMQVGPIYKTDGFGFVFPRGSPMAGDVSREILKLAEGDKMAHIEKAWFGEPGACQNALDGIGRGGGSSNLSFWRFGGLFLITGVVSTLMLLLYLAIFAYREREELREAEAKAEAEAARSPTFKTWNDGSPRNGNDSAGRTPRWNGGAGDASMPPRDSGEEHQHAMEGTSPLSVYISSEMNAGSSPEGTPASKISESFEQRIEGAAAAVEETMPTASQLQQ